MDLNDYWYKEFSEPRLAFNYLRDMIENKGIIVMQNGIVGTNTHRNLDVNEFRGFLLYDDYATLIFINSKDSVKGKIFTLIHEYASKLAVGIKLREMGKVNQETVNKIREIMEFDLENKKTKNSGGNFYITNKSRYSDSFAKSVVNGAESGNISYTYAFELFDGSAKTYDYFKVVMT